MITGLYETVPAGVYMQPEQCKPEYEKDMQWHLDNARFIYASHFKSPLYTKQLDFPKRLTYATGTQDITICKRMMGLMPRDKNAPMPYGLSKDDNGNLFPDDSINLNEQRPVDVSNYAFVDWSKILSPAPKLIDKIIGMLDAHKYKLEVSAIDQTSLKDKKRNKTKMKVLMKEKDFFNEINAMAGMTLKSMPEMMPNSSDELEMLDKLGYFELPYERGIRKAIKWTQEYSDSEDIDRELKYDLITYGFACAVDKIEQGRDIVLHEHIKADNVILANSKGANSYDSPYGGYLKFYSIMDIRYITGWSEDKIRNIAVIWANNSTVGNSVAVLDDIEKYSQTGACNYNDIVVPVLYTEWKSEDVEYDTDKHYIKGKIRKGELESGKVLKDDNGYYKKISEPRVNTRIPINYQCSWVVGTDCVLPDFGKKYVNTYSQTSHESPLSIHCYFLKGKSLVERIEPMLDFFAVAGFKFQNDTYTSLPVNTLLYEMGSLQAASNAMKDKPDPFDLIRIGKAGGAIVWKYEADIYPGGQGNNLPIRPVEILQGTGMGAALSDLNNAMQSFNVHISNLMGVDMTSTMSLSPKDEKPVGIAKQEFEGMLDGLKPIQIGVVSIVDNLVSNTATRVQLIAAATPESDYEKDNSGYKLIMTKEEWMALKKAGQPSNERDFPAYYGLKMKMKLKDNIKTEMRMAAQGGMAGGKNGIPALTYSEYIFLVASIEDDADMDDVRAYIAYKESQKDTQAQQIAANAEQANTDRMLQQEQMKSTNAMKLVALEKDLELRNAKEVEISKVLGQIMIDEKKSENEILTQMSLSPEVQNEIKMLSGMMFSNEQQPQNINNQQMPTQNEPM